jgi:hypothetical protein
VIVRKLRHQRRLWLRQHDILDVCHFEAGLRRLGDACRALVDDEIAYVGFLSTIPQIGDMNTLELPSAMTT